MSDFSLRRAVGPRDGRNGGNERVRPFVPCFGWQCSNHATVPLTRLRHEDGRVTHHHVNLGGDRVPIEHLIPVKRPPSLEQDSKRSSKLCSTCAGTASARFRLNLWSSPTDPAEYVRFPTHSAVPLPATLENHIYFDERRRQLSEADLKAGSVPYSFVVIKEDGTKSKEVYFTHEGSFRCVAQQPGFLKLQLSGQRPSASLQARVMATEMHLIVLQMDVENTRFKTVHAALRNFLDVVRLSSADPARFGGGGGAAHIGCWSAVGHGGELVLSEDSRNDNAIAGQ